MSLLDTAPWEQPSPIRSEFGKLAHHARHALEAGDTDRLIEIAERLPKVGPWGESQTDLYVRIAPHLPVADQMFRRAEKLNQALLEGMGTDLQQLRRDWPNLPIDEKVEFMQAALDRQTQMYGLKDSPRLGLFDEEKGVDGGLWYGRYDSRPNRVEINQTPDGMINNFDDCMATVVHEGTHAVQCGMAKMYRQGRIPKGHPLEQTARVFAIEEDFYIRCDDEKHFPDGDVYDVTPAERHAFHADKDFTHQVRHGAANRAVNAMRRHMVNTQTATAGLAADADGQNLLGSLTASVSGGHQGTTPQPHADRVFDVDRLKR